MPTTFSQPHLLASLLSPKTIAVIGASRDEGSIGRAVFENILQGNYTGTAYPVNPKANSVSGVRAYPSVSEIPEDVDLAVIIVPASIVPRIAEECGRRGVKGLIVVSAGFKEVGREGAKLEHQLVSIVRKYSMRLVGPNCLGIANTDPAVRLNLSFATKMPAPGSIGFVSQSGALCAAVLDYARGQNMGFSQFISMGNKADVNENDLLEYLRRDPKTKVILLYVEDIVDGRRFIDIARKTTEHKPIIAVKAGVTTEGARAASSHTGSLAGSDEAYDAIFRQSGVLRVESVTELFDYARAFALQPLPRGNRVAIVTNGGGPGIMATDACVRYGLKIAKFDPETVRELRSGLPRAASVKNPVDIIGDAEAHRYEFAVSRALGDKGVDCGLVMLAPQAMYDIRKIAEGIAAAISKSGKTTATCLMGLVDISPAIEVLEKKGIPHYSFPEAACRSLATLYNYDKWIERPRTRVKRFDVDTAFCRKIIRRAQALKITNLPQHDALKILDVYGVPVAKTILATSKKEALAAARKIGYPMVMKVVSSDVLHKVDVGGVRLNLKNEREVAEAYHAIIANVRAKLPEARVEGVILQEQVEGGVETIVGMRRDRRFGPLLMFGLGGIYVEVYQDLAFRLAPIRQLSAKDMIRQIRGIKILEGFRGQRASDISSIEDVLLRISQLATDLPEVLELDVNPLMALEKGCKAVDSRIIIRRTAASS